MPGLGDMLVVAVGGSEPAAYLGPAAGRGGEGGRCMNFVVVAVIAVVVFLAAGALLYYVRGVRPPPRRRRRGGGGGGVLP